MLSATYIVTFVVFFMEALFHFNLGKYGTISLTNLSIPQGQELFDIVKVLAIFSAINSYLVPIVNGWMEGGYGSNAGQSGRISIG